MFRFKLNKTVSQAITDSGINQNTALFAAQEARMLMHEFVPFDTGALAMAAQISAADTTGTVRYTRPYAKFCYYGDKKNFSRDKHEKATAYWDIAMTAALRGTLTGRVNKFIKNKTG